MCCFAKCKRFEFRKGASIQNDKKKSITSNETPKLYKKKSHPIKKNNQATKPKKTQPTKKTINQPKKTTTTTTKKQTKQEKANFLFNWKDPDFVSENLKWAQSNFSMQLQA